MRQKDAPLRPTRKHAQRRDTGRRARSTFKERERRRVTSARRNLSLPRCQGVRVIGAKHSGVHSKRPAQIVTTDLSFPKCSADLAHAQQAARSVRVALTQAGQMAAQRRSEQRPGLPWSSGAQQQHAQVPQRIGGIVVQIAQDASANSQRGAQVTSGHRAIPKRLVEQPEPIHLARGVAMRSAQDPAMDIQRCFQHPARTGAVAHLQRQHAQVAERTGRDRVLAPDGSVEEPESCLKLRPGLLKSPLVVVDPPDMVARDADEGMHRTVDLLADRQRAAELHKRRRILAAGPVEVAQVVDRH
jgi:hypothetical protein